MTRSKFPALQGRAARGFSLIEILVVMALILAVSRYGDLKLGGEDDEPEFSIGAWFAMLFAAGMGIGLVFWGVAEPISHYGAPPPGIAAHTPEAANAAMRYSFFHWGLHPWAVYSIVALAIAFFQFRRGGVSPRQHGRISPAVGATAAHRPGGQHPCGNRHGFQRGRIAGHGRAADQQRPGCHDGRAGE